MLEAAARSGSVQARASLELPIECPPSLLWAWERYLDLRQGRSPGFGGPSLTWQDLEAWMRLRGIRLEQREIDLMFELEAVQPKEFDPND